MGQLFVCDVSDLTERNSHVYVVNDVEIAVILLDNEVYVYENICPHMGGPVGLGDLFGRVKVELGEHKKVVREYTDDNEMCLVCPYHGYEFNAKSGECVPDPALRLGQFKTVVDNGKVYIEL